MRFSEIAGNGQIKGKLIQTVLDQRVSHAQLFFGPEDSSKIALAIAYAQFINCTNKQGISGKEEFSNCDVRFTNLPENNVIDSCGACPSCIKYQKLIHPDLHFIYPVATTKRVTKKPQSKYFIEDWRKFLIDNNYQSGLQSWFESIGIENKQGIINAEDCNEIITTLSYKSYESDYKVMIIWMVEKLYYSAAPKILKILEEPPEKTLFILISEEPDQIIKTILSRTLMVKIPKSDIIGNGTNDDDKIHFEAFRSWMRYCFAGKIPDLIAFASEITKAGREKQKSLLGYSLRVIGYCASVNYRQPIPEGLEGEELKFIRDFSPFITSDNLIEFNTLLNDAIFHVERNAHTSTLFLDLSLKFVRKFKPNFVPL
ncbi:MAG: DNA polymerase III subunit delta [Bacteroidota bacterium]